MDVDPGKLRRGDVEPRKDDAAAEETAENGCDRNITAAIFPAAGEECDHSCRDEWQEEHEPGKRAVSGKRQDFKALVSRESRERR